MLHLGRDLGEAVDTLMHEIAEARGDLRHQLLGVLSVVSDVMDRVDDLHAEKVGVEEEYRTLRELCAGLADGTVPVAAVTRFVQDNALAA